MARVKSPQDLGAGLVFACIGIAGLYFASELPFGTSARMGPGYFPTVLSVLIITVGIVVGLRGVVTDGPAIEPVQLRPIAFVVGAILLFGAVIQSIGLALSAVLLTMVAALARREVKLVETLLLGAGLAGFAITVFVYLLGAPLPAWWGR